jgi:phosphotransacetylase
MTITQEEIKEVLTRLGKKYRNFGVIESEMTTLDFANHFYELGRKDQRESDAATVRAWHVPDDEIINNTGDLT